MTRFFISDANLKVDQFFILKGKSHRKLSKVLRLGLGSDIFLFNNTGFEFVAKIVEIQNQSTKLFIIKKIKIEKRDNSHISIALGIMKGKRFEWSLQKLTEMGVNTIIPLFSERCIYPSISKSKCERWQKIIEEASRQCGRVNLPKLEIPTKFENVIESSSKDYLKLILDPSSAHSLNKILSSSKLNQSLILIGPEGGWTQKEMQTAQNKGFEAITLGPSILRSETAPLVITVLLQNHFGFFS